MDDRLDLCFDAYVEGERFDESMLPSPIDQASASSDELALAWRKQWQPGQELRIRFMDGDPAVHALVTALAREWLEHANLLFDFGNHVAAEIEISFKGSVYSSLVGTDALRRRDRSQPTMRLGGFTIDSDRSKMRRTVLHEFGHAIGCIHEQSSPSVAIPWDVPAVYRYYREWQGWDDETILHNVLMRYSAAEARFTAHDPTSIMQYPVPQELTIGDFSIGWNDDLSAGDKAFIAKMYPP